MGGACSTNNQPVFKSALSSSSSSSIQIKFKSDPQQAYILVLGLRGCGKSSLVHSLLKQTAEIISSEANSQDSKTEQHQFNSHPIPLCGPTRTVTQHAVDLPKPSSKHFKSSQLSSQPITFIDTPGISRRKMNSISLLSYATKVLYVIDSTDECGIELARSYLKIILNSSFIKTENVIIILTKRDLPNALSVEVLRQRLAIPSRDLNIIPVKFEISLPEPFLTPLSLHP